MRRVLLVVGASAGVAVGALLACNAILGIDDLPPRGGVLQVQNEAGAVLFSANCGTAGAAQSLTFTNPSIATVQWTASLGKGDQSPFTIDKNSGAILPGQSAQLTITPKSLSIDASTDPGAYTDKLTLHAPPGADVTLDLQLLAAGAALVVTPSPLDAGDQPYNGNSPGFPVSVTNTGNRPASFTVGTSPPWFTSPKGDQTLLPDASFQTWVTFSPTTSGPQTGTLDIKVSGTGTVLCGQLNGIPLLGNGTLGVVEIASGTRHTCARRSDGTVACWGNDQRGQLGNGQKGPGLNFGTPQEVLNLPAPATGLGLGWRFSCAGLSPNGVACWGDNEYQQSGGGTNVLSQPPTKLLSDNTSDAAYPYVALQVVGAGYTACARDQAGNIWCWGDNGDNSTGTPFFGQAPAVAFDSGSTTTPYPIPVPVNGPIQGSDVAIGSQLCVRSVSKTLCWPNLNVLPDGGLGDGSTYLPLPITTSDGGPLGGLRMSAGGASFYALQPDGTVLSWGDNSQGQLGDGTTTASPTKTTQVSGLTDAVLVKGALQGACAIRRNGSIVCWGDNTQGQLGDGTTTPALTPVAVNGLPEPAVSISSCTWGICNFTCAVTVGGHVWCWGANNLAQLGQGDSGITGSLVPLRVQGL